MPLIRSLPRPRTPAHRPAAIACLTALALQGCSSAVTLPAAGPIPTGDVSVDLTPEGATSLVGSLGPRAATLDGRLASRSDSALDLIVTQVRRTTGSEESWPSDRVRVPTAAVRAVRVHRVSVARSIVLAGGIAVGAFLLGRAIGGADASGSSRGGGGPGSGQ